jgi:hypothetical protein
MSQPINRTQSLRYDSRATPGFYNVLCKAKGPEFVWAAGDRRDVSSAQSTKARPKFSDPYLFVSAGGASHVNPARKGWEKRRTPAPSTGGATQVFSSSQHNRKNVRAPSLLASRATERGARSRPPPIPACHTAMLRFRVLLLLTAHYPLLTIPPPIRTKQTTYSLSLTNSYNMLYWS